MHPPHPTHLGLAQQTAGCLNTRGLSASTPPSLCSKCTRSSARTLAPSCGRASDALRRSPHCSSAAECERLHASTRGQYFFVHVERVLSQETLQLHFVARVRIMFQKMRALFSLMLVCSPGARWYVKVDTDTILNLPQLAIQLEGLSRPADYIGKQISLFSYRANQSKVWYMQGGVYALSNRAATAMLSCPLGSWMNCPDKVLRDSNHKKDKQAVATGSCYSEGTLNRDDLYAGMCMREAGMVSHNLCCALSLPREALQTRLSKLGMGEASRSASLMKQRRAIVQSHARQCSCPVSLHPLKSDDKLQDAKTLLLYMSPTSQNEGD